MFCLENVLCHVEVVFTQSLKIMLKIINCLGTLNCIIIGSSENATRLSLKICVYLC